MIECKPYKAAVLPETEVSPGEFESGKLDTEILNRIRMTVKVEEPITKELLEIRIRNSFGLFAFGCNIRKKYEEILAVSDLKCRTIMGQEVMWYSDPPDKLAFFRTRSEDRYKFRHVPVPELEAAMRYASGLLGPEAAVPLLFEVTRIVLGFNRMSSGFRVAMEKIYPGIFD